MLPVVLRPNRTAGAVYFFLCLFFAATSMYGGYHNTPPGYLGAAFFGFGVLLYGLQIHPKTTYLRLEEDGFTCCVLFRAYSYRWADVRDFSVFHTGHLHRVGWNFTPTYLNGSRKRDLSIQSKALCGYEAHLQNGYGMTPEKLADLLNRVLHERTSR